MGERESLKDLPPPMANEIEWRVHQFSSLRQQKQGATLMSDSKEYRGVKFNIAMCPRTKKKGRVAAYVMIVPSNRYQHRWTFGELSYRITAVNWLDWRDSLSRNGRQIFCSVVSGWGWHDLFSGKEQSLSPDWLGPNCELVIRGAVFAPEALPVAMPALNCAYTALRDDDDGSSSYMSALLHCLFHIGFFRSALFRAFENGAAKTATECVNDGSFEGTLRVIEEAKHRPRKQTVLVAMEDVFSRLERPQETPACCSRLLKSFGWESADRFTRHNIHRLLFEHVEEQMNGTPSEGVVKLLFEGVYESYVECVDFDHKVVRQMDFRDLQLDVRGLHSVSESLRKIVEPSIMGGDKWFEAEGLGRQRARKGIRFRVLPPVLLLRLKRFEFNLDRTHTAEKICDRFEYPDSVNLNHLVPDAGSYSLHAVIVHDGLVGDKRHYAFIRPQARPQQWVRFGDGHVVPATRESATVENFGGPDESLSPPPLRRRALRERTAVALFYVRAALSERLLAPT
eukprot:Polyplicarium_translucidae@DN2671_c0_g1_i1.p1